MTRDACRVVVADPASPAALERALKLLGRQREFARFAHEAKRRRIAKRGDQRRFKRAWARRRLRKKAAEASTRATFLLAVPVVGTKP